MPTGVRDHGRPVDWVPAGELVVGVAGERRLLRPALVGGELAACGEATALRWIGEIRREAGDREQRLARVCVETRDRTEQRLRVGVAHRAEELLARRLLDDATGIHDVDSLGATGDNAHVVGDQQRRHSEALLEVVEHLQDLRLDRHVQRRGGLVGEQHLRLAGQRDRDHDALTQATGELVRVVAEPLSGAGQTNQLQHLERAIERLLAVCAAVQPHRLGHLLADRLRRVQR